MQNARAAFTISAREGLRRSVGGNACKSPVYCSLHVLTARAYRLAGPQQKQIGRSLRLTIGRANKRGFPLPRNRPLPHHRWIFARPVPLKRQSPPRVSPPAKRQSGAAPVVAPEPSFARREGLAEQLIFLRHGLNHARPLLPFSASVPTDPDVPFSYPIVDPLCHTQMSLRRQVCKRSRSPRS